MTPEHSPSLQRLWAVLKFAIVHFLRDGCRQHAAALTYTTLFAVVPIMTVTFAILSAIPSLQSMGGTIQDFIFRHFIPSAGTSIADYLHDFSVQASHLTLVGVAILFVTALLMLLTIENAFNQIWRVQKARKGMVAFIRYWAVLSLGPLLLGLGFAASSYLASFSLLQDTASIVGHVVPGLGLLALFFSALGFTLLYLVVPNCTVPWRAGVIGGTTAAVLFEAAKKGFTVFVSNFSSYKLIYGAFAAFPIFLVWIYLSWIIILFGVELTRAITIVRVDVQGHRHPVLTLMDILQLFYRRFAEGHSVRDRDALAVLGHQDAEAWAQIAAMLQEQRIIHRTEEGEFVLGRNLDQLDFWDFYRRLPWPLPQAHDLACLGADDHWAELLRPALERSQHHLEAELCIPLGRILAGSHAVVVDPRNGAAC